MVALSPALLLPLLALSAPLAPLARAAADTSSFCTDSDPSIAQGCCSSGGGTYDNATNKCFGAAGSFGTCITSHFGNARTTNVAHTARCEANGAVTWSFKSSAGALAVSAPLVAGLALAVVTLA
ncbi:hypothetical protein Q8F55_002814 [Vanrija albida]|uniref:Extracellular membrane protein CFEM domain-containing protein n=1 Tax=Vanrija albida TaxID=181172 RepID=A0ABR3QAV8_9TREE